MESGGSMVRKVLLAMAPATTISPAQVVQFENKRIVDIQFLPVQPLDPADLHAALPFQKGDPLRADDVANAIDNLFASGRFEDIIAEAEPSGDGVVVRFVTQLTWFLGGVKVEGKVMNPDRKRVQEVKR